ncbi:transporter substrate-binding domain-containing protein [Brevibacillus humidisoli]|uniref:transporter substrate-binding domain-containing protein n=1 Tax=Brevibacillus humidisoli TaxID=2895522 RepID=UPI001E4D48A2|nr:transporter substrate-binding domain-containing protein [Brevibacillus humidisoli]UFJ42485.1 transporter substrate-binding domain-containing protein [Brevibacillus humidisoli]
MERLTRSVLSISIAIILCFLMTKEVSRADNQQVIRIAGDNNFPPFEYIGEAGSYTGFNIDVLNAVSIETGLKIEYVPMSWNQALSALRNGIVDAVQGMKYSRSRDVTYDFSKPYFISSQGIFVLKNNMFIHHIRDLEGRRVALQKGDIANDLLSQLERTEFVATESQEEAIQLLLNGQVDAFVGNRITGQYFIQRKNQQSLIKIVGEPINPTDYGVAVMPHNRELLSMINQGIEQIKRNGTYEKIERKWFGEYIMPSAVKLQRVLFYLQLGLAASLLIFLGVAWWNRQLKREVTKRTNEISAINVQLQEKMRQLQENLQFQQQLLDSTYSSYVTLDRAMNILMNNRKALDYLLLDQPIIGHNLTETVLSQFIPVREVALTLSDGTVHQQQECRWSPPQWQSERERVIRYSIYPIYGTSMVITGAIINFQDVTEQKEMEKKIEREDRLRSLGQLMLGIAHEIRNPLMSILTYTQLLPKKFDNAKFREFFGQQVPKEIQRLNALVGDLLEYAQPKHSQPTRFSVERLVESVLVLLKPRIKEKQLVVETELSEGVFALADPHQIKQVMINLVINAIDAMESGGVLRVRAYYEEQITVVEVEDNGYGIPDEELDRIFEPFHTSKPHGVGLGLSISYQLIKKNNGVIDVKSQRNQGTTMIIQLPRPEEGVERNASFNRY